jgi:enolase
LEAIEKAGHKGKVELGMDVAASEFFVADKKCYDLDFKNPNNDGSKQLSVDALTDLYADFINKYSIVSIEDPFD